MAAQDREERSSRVIMEDLLDFGIKLLGQRHAADSDHRRLALSITLAPGDAEDPHLPSRQGRRPTL
ncbi:MAG: hypothetical protein IPK80_00045 [Nannocystis sp.]|nr:hypothetical protein [Nannocystis sp.]